MSLKKKDQEDDLKVKPISSVMKKLKKEYDKDKKDWRVISSKDKDGNLDTFITKKPNAYWLKSKQLGPYSSLSMGSYVRNIDRDIDSNVGKKISPEDMLRLFGMVVPIKGSQGNQNLIATGIEKYSQKHGDYLKKVIGERDSNLGPQMGRKIDAEFTKRHPQRKNLYI